MSVLAYETDEEKIRRGCLAHGLQLLQFCPQEAARPGASTPQTGTSPQWFVAVADRGGELYVVFRGTKGTADWFRDACVNPERHGADKFHSGFLSAVRDDAVLREVLRLHLRDDAALFACGHSLGGALAMTLLSADGLLPPTFTGSRTAVALGSPAVAHGQIARRCRTILVVQDADPVPRLLGASMDITRGLFQASPVGIGLGSDILESMSQYRHPPELEMVYLTRGNAYVVPAAKQKAVLNLHEALGPTTMVTGFVCWRVESGPRPGRLRGGDRLGGEKPHGGARNPCGSRSPCTLRSRVRANRENIHRPPSTIAGEPRKHPMHHPRWCTTVH